MPLPTVTLAESLFESGTQALERGGADDLAQAEALLRQALALAPRLAEAHANLAWLLDRRGARDEALSHYVHAAGLQPDNARIHLNHGALLAECRQPHAAEASYRRALALEPTWPGVWSNLGALLAVTGRDTQAEHALRHALALGPPDQPPHAGAQFNLACLLLRQGRFEEGWQRLEARDWYAPVAARLNAPRWRGEALTGRRILVVYEAGHGDLVQFCRYVPLLKARGAHRVDVLCHPALKTLLQSLDGVATVTAFNDTPPEPEPDPDGAGDGAPRWHCWVPALSLPWLCGTHSVEAIPAALPYLHAPPDRLAHWRAVLDQRLPSAPTATVRPRRVGLVWRGSTAFENDAERSLPDLSLLAPLWQVPGLHFISLQKGAGEDEARRPPPGQPLLDIAADLHDFADTAAVIAQLDLVISVDTGVAHLAGALGKPCWVLLPSYMTDWRWLEHRSDSPWYPGVVRLFRRQPGQDWPVEALRDALAQGVSPPAGTRTA